MLMGLRRISVTLIGLFITFSSIIDRLLSVYCGILFWYFRALAQAKNYLQMVHLNSEVANIRIKFLVNITIIT